jgi:hypothetical protein
MTVADHPKATNLAPLGAHSRDRTAPIVAVWRDVSYTEGELKLAFDCVANPRDWRAPVDAIVPNAPALKTAIEAAVMFYTATPAIFHFTNRDGYVRVVAKGYRNGPAGP